MKIPFIGQIGSRLAALFNPRRENDGAVEADSKTFSREMNSAEKVIREKGPADGLAAVAAGFRKSTAQCFGLRHQCTYEEMIQAVKRKQAKPELFNALQKSALALRRAEYSPQEPSEAEVLKIAEEIRQIARMGQKNDWAADKKIDQNERIKKTGIEMDGQGRRGRVK